MRNVTLRTTTKGTAVVLERVTLVDKKLFKTYQEAAEYVAKLSVDEAFSFKKGRERNVTKEDTQDQSPKTQNS